MKKQVIALFLFGLICNLINAQDFSRKYGKITNYELEMKTYLPDTTAGAVVLYEDGYTSYDLLNNSFIINTSIKKKIKILKESGVNEGTFNIDYYYKSSDQKEAITNLEAIAYNLENGKTVKSKLEKKYIFEEELSKNYRRIKFSVPNVKVGTVIELKYTKSSNMVYSIDTWYFQTDIPVMYASYEVSMPEYFVFNIETRGYENIKTTNTDKNQNFTINTQSGGMQNITCNTRVIQFTASEIPALKDEEYVYCSADYLSCVRFELKATNFPYEYYKPYSQTWEDLEKAIEKETSFGVNLKMQNPFKDEIKLAIAGITDEKSKIEAVYSYIINRMKWNEQYSFLPSRIKEATKNGVGDNGQINMVLISALKDIGINAYPILMSRRSLGRLPYTYPSIEQLNTLVVAAAVSDSVIYYMDGSTRMGGLNMLPVELISDRARAFGSSVSEKWVDLTTIARSKEVNFIQSELTETALLQVNQINTFTYQDALAYKKKYYAAKDSATYISDLETNKEIEIKSAVIKGLEPMSTIVEERLEYQKQLSQSGDFIYLNPMIFAHISENKFTQSDRKLPIEFPYCTVYTLSSTIKIPANYTVTEIPKSNRIALNDKCKLTYMIKTENNVIQLVYKFELNQIFFSGLDYAKIREYFAGVAGKNQEMIVLKKNS